MNKTTNKKKKDIADIHWIDSVIYNEEVSFDRIDKPSIFRTAGLIVDESDEHIAIAREIDNKKCRGVISIPKFAIKKIRRL